MNSLGKFRLKLKVISLTVRSEYFSYWTISWMVYSWFHSKAVFPLLTLYTVQRYLDEMHSFLANAATQCIFPWLSARRLKNLCNNRSPWRTWALFYPFSTGSEDTIVRKYYRKNPETKLAWHPHDKHLPVVAVWNVVISRSYSSIPLSPQYRSYIKQLRNNLHPKMQSWVFCSFILGVIISLNESFSF